MRLPLFVFLGMLICGLSAAGLGLLFGCSGYAPTMPMEVTLYAVVGIIAGFFLGLFAHRLTYLPPTKVIASTPAPAQAKAGVDESDTPMNSITGLWRDGTLLIVNLAGRCPWANEEIASVIQIPVYGPHPAGWHYTLLRGFRYGAKRELLMLSVPASDGWQQRRDAVKRKFGYLIALFGLAGIVAGISMYFILNRYDPSVFDRPHPNDFTWGVFLMTAGVFAIVVGLACPKLEAAPGPGGYVRAELIDEPYVWIRGADPKYLELLPAWTGARLAERKRAGPSLLDALGQIPIVVVLLAVFAIVIITLILQSK